MRRVPSAPRVPLLERGVWKALWQGPSGEIVLLAITSEHKLLTGTPHLISAGADHIAAADALWELLELRDPITPEQADTARRRILKVI